MKEVAINKNSKYIFLSDTFKSLSIQLVYFFVGLLSSKGAVLGEYSPFGAAFIAAVPYGYLFSSLSGGVLGYILPSTVNSSMRYIASIISVAAIRWTLNDLKKLTNYSIFSPIVAFVPLISTGLAIASVDDFKISVVMPIVLEASLSAAGAYFFSNTVKFSKTRNKLNNFSHEEFACICMTICITILSFSNLYIQNISIGRILAILIILLCARYGGVAGGSVAGIAAGIVFSISSSSLSYISGAYAFAGMMAGLFSPIGKFATCITFIVSNIIVTSETAEPSKIFVSLYEVIISSTAFLFLPKHISDKFTYLFSKQSNSIKSDSLRNAITLRLDYVSNAMKDVSESILSVSKKLEKINIENINQVHTNAISHTCKGCGLKIFCWEKERDFTIRAFSKINSKLEIRSKVDKTDFPELFINRCCKLPEMINSINKFYDEFVIKESAQKRIGEIRAVLSEQFTGISRMLKDIETEFKEYEKFDETTANKIMIRLKQLEIIPLDVSCRENKLGRLSVEIEIINHNRKQLNNSVLGKEISNICKRNMGTPLVSYADDRCRIQMSEKPEINLQIGTAQHVCKNGKWCGDSFSYFDDGMGRKIILISDGMGTGGRAAVDGTMTNGIMNKLIKAGLGFNSALKIVNSALLAKSTEESLATVDITCVDMFTGQTEFLKAGASSTYVRKGNRVIRVNTPSLPVGILTDVELSSSKVALEEGDWILMTSDGALSNGEKWIQTEFKNYEGDNPKEFAKYIVDMAVKRNAEAHDDDVTAIAIKFTY